MTETIKLTDEEARAVAKTAWGWPEHPTDQAGRLAETVLEVVNALNRYRTEGDPIGTVRRCQETGRIAVRVEGATWLANHQGFSWHYQTGSGARHLPWSDTAADDALASQEIRNWDLLYRPEVEAGSLMGLRGITPKSSTSQPQIKPKSSDCCRSNANERIFMSDQDKEFIQARDQALYQLSAVIPFDVAERLLDAIIEEVDRVMAEEL